uniref:Uncharacterized protein n=1 Tax=Plectus sambesii TaxID=2011161 RepID=A0A914XKZ1_9BILA
MDERDGASGAYVINKDMLHAEIYCNGEKSIESREVSAIMAESSDDETEEVSFMIGDCDRDEGISETMSKTEILDDADCCKCCLKENGDGCNTNLLLCICCDRIGRQKIYLGCGCDANCCEGSYGTASAAHRHNNRRNCCILM